MKVKELLEELKKAQKTYGKDFLEWDVFTEQITAGDRKQKTKGVQKMWRKVKDEEGWEYFECVGFWTHFPHKKIFTINVNY